MSIDKAIISATDKDFKGFEKSISKVLDDKMKTTVGGFVKYLEKNTFKSDKDE